MNQLERGEHALVLKTESWSIGPICELARSTNH